MGTIVNLAQDYVGSNNINVLLPIGQDQAADIADILMERKDSSVEKT